jgi:transcription initiation factor TFIID TATA-box-binding protein
VAETLDLEIVIQNVVASASLDQKFNLLDIVKTFSNVEYNPKRFPGLVFRLKRPKTATLIFSTGKMVCTGAKSEKLAKSAVNKVVRELKKNGIVVLGKPVIIIQNIVASANLHSQVDLETASDVLDNVMYEPEQFPGLWPTQRRSYLYSPQARSCAQGARARRSSTSQYTNCTNCWATMTCSTIKLFIIARVQDSTRGSVRFRSIIQVIIMNLMEIDFCVCSPFSSLSQTCGNHGLFEKAQYYGKANTPDL